MIRLARFICALALLGANCVYAQQAQVPSLIRIIVPFAAGGSTDVIARSLASQLSVRLNTTVIVENRTGGGGLIGASIVAKGAKDGSVLLLSTASLATAAATGFLTTVSGLGTVAAMAGAASSSVSTSKPESRKSLMAGL